MAREVLAPQEAVTGLQAGTEVIVHQDAVGTAVQEQEEAVPRVCMVAVMELLAVRARTGRVAVMEAQGVAERQGIRQFYKISGSVDKNMKHGFMDNPIVFEIKCRFNPTHPVGGTHLLPRELYEGKTGKEIETILQIVDHRCDACLIEHGKYTDMEKQARMKGLTNEEFKDVMQRAGFSKKTFGKHLDDKVKEKGGIITL